MDRDALTAALAEHWKGTVPAEAPSILEARLRAISERFPGLKLDRPRFVAHLASRLDASLTLAEALEIAAVEDLAIAWGCAGGDREALRAFEAEAGRELKRLARNAKLRGHSPEDIEQMVRERLLVAAEGRPARIADYSGRGSLKSWVRAAASRVIVNLAEAQKPEHPISQVDELEGAQTLDGELRPLRERYKEQFRRAFPIAIRALSSKERAALRGRFVHRLTVEEIAKEQGVHVATVARWLSSGRERLAAEMRAIVLASEKVSPSELESIVRLVRADLEVTVERLLPTVDPDAG